MPSRTTGVGAGTRCSARWSSVTSSSRSASIRDARSDQLPSLDAVAAPANTAPTSLEPSERPHAGWYATHRVAVHGQVEEIAVLSHQLAASRDRATLVGLCAA